MPITKIYKCCICHKVLDTKPHRLVHQEYEVRGYGQYKNKHNFDFCDKCFNKYLNWIRKHKEGANEKGS